MPLLPRSRRGTWLLAGAVWVAACAALWWWLPPSPRRVIHIDRGVRKFDFSPDGRFLVTVSLFQLDQPYEEHYRGNLPDSFRIWDCVTGEMVAGPIEAWSSLLPWRPSRDRRWWCLGMCDSSNPGVQVFDVVNRRVEVLNGVSRRDVLGEDATFSSDSRLLMINAVVDDVESLLLWDLHNRRICGTLPGAELPADVSPDGRFLAATATVANRSMIRVFDRASLRPIVTLLSRQREHYRSIGFSPDSENLLATFTPVFERPDGDLGDFLAPIRSEFRSWSIRSAVQNFSLTDVWGRFAFAPDGRTVITEQYDSDGHRLEWRDLENGQLRNAAKIDRESAPSIGTDSVSPDGQALVVQLYSTEPALFEQLTRRLGLNWPKQSDSTWVGCRVLDTNSGKHLTDFPGCNPRWSPDGQSIAAFTKNEYRGSVIALWDIPPQKSLTWFAAGAVGLALPIALLARRRVRKLRAA